MSGKYFIFSITRPAALPSSLCAGLVVLLAFGFLVCPSDGIPVAVPNESSTAASISSSTTVKILIPPSAAEDDDDDAIIIEGGNSTNPNVPQEPFHPRDCFMEKVKGPCRAIIDMWFFNTATKACEEFQYSGCGGNGNRFAEKSECENRCAGKAKNNGDQTIDEDSDSIVIDAGRVDSTDDNNGTCPEFDGCGPLKCAEITDEKTGCKKCACSLLPDDSEDERMPPVGSVSGTPSEDDEKRKTMKPEDICSLPEVRGDCRAMVTRFRYDSKTKGCIMFHFGGCNSNGNNFVSEEKCMQYCKGQ